MKIVKTLPLLASQVSLLLIRKPGQKCDKIYSVERKRVENALFTLCYGIPNFGLSTPVGKANKLYTGKDHINRRLTNRYYEFLPNEFYYDVEISNYNLNQLPRVRSELPNICEVPLTDEPNLPPHDQDGGPAQDQIIPPDSDNDTVSWSGIPEILLPKDIDLNIKDILKNFYGNDIDKAIDDEIVAKVSMPKKNKDAPVDPLSVPGFFTKAFPCIFVNGSCDPTIKDRLFRSINSKNIDLWIEHIYYNQDNRVAKHPFLKFLLTNIKNKYKAFSQSDFCVNSTLRDPQLTVDDLTERHESGDFSTGKQILRIAGNIPTSSTG